MRLLTTGLLLSFAFMAITESVPAEVDNPHVEYLPPANDSFTPLAEDGYRYRTVKRLKYRLRREVPTAEYASPVAAEPFDEYIPPEYATGFAGNGYSYKNVRRLRFRVRHHRDVSKFNSFSSAEYLPRVDAELAPEFENMLDDDGYQYKTVPRLKFRRQRREAEAMEVPAVIDIPIPFDEVAKQSEVKGATLAQNGYRYKTVRRLIFRHRQ